MSDINHKIKSLGELAEITARLRAEGKTVAQCHGCFDLMHPGHIKHFEAASKVADVLIVTLTPDRFVNKGPSRPVFSERLRAEAIAALGSADYVIINDSPTAVEAIEKIKPSFYVKGSEYKSVENDITGKITDEENDNSKEKVLVAAAAAATDQQEKVQQLEQHDGLPISDKNKDEGENNHHEDKDDDNMKLFIRSYEFFTQIVFMGLLLSLNTLFHRRSMGATESSPLCVCSGDNYPHESE